MEGGGWPKRGGDFFKDGLGVGVGVGVWGSYPGAHYAFL